MKIILGTRNPSKALQIRTMFTGTPVIVRTLADEGIEGEAVEDGDSLQENAEKKAVHAHERGDKTLWKMADDTGIFITSLGGEPGRHAKRWAGENKTTDEITQYVLMRLAGAADRSATFETVVALISPEGKKYFFSGTCPGTLLTAPRCIPQPEMPYSPIFVPDGETKVWGEMTTEYENRISHRGRAFAKVRDFLQEFME